METRWRSKVRGTEDHGIICRLSEKVSLATSLALAVSSSTGVALRPNYNFVTLLA